MGFKKCFGQFLDKEKGRGAGGQINQRPPNKEQGVSIKCVVVLSAKDFLKGTEALAHKRKKFLPSAVPPTSADIFYQWERIPIL